MGLHCSTELPSEEGPANFTPSYMHTAAPCKQKHLLREMLKPYFVDLRQLRTGLGRMNHILFTWIIHGWIMAGCGVTGEQHIVLGKRIFLQCFVFWGEAEWNRRDRVWIRRFLNVRFKKLSTNQNRGITWLSQGCSNTTLGTRLMKLCKC